MIEELGLQVKLSVEIVLFDVNFSPELDDISQDNQLLSVPDKECLRIEAVRLVNDIRVDKPMEGDLLGVFVVSRALGLSFGRWGNLGISAFMMVWVSIVYFISVFVEDLKLDEVDTLLDEVHVSKVLQM